MASREQQPRGRRNRMSAWYGANVVAEKAANPHGRNGRIDYSGPAKDVRQCRPCGEQQRSLHIYRNTIGLPRRHAKRISLLQLRI
jgi:hypothetical protein